MEFFLFSNHFFEEPCKFGQFSSQMQKLRNKILNYIGLKTKLAKSYNSQIVEQYFLGLYFEKHEYLFNNFIKLRYLVFYFTS